MLHMYKNTCFFPNKEDNIYYKLTYFYPSHCPLKAISLASFQLCFSDFLTLFPCFLKLHPKTRIANVSPFRYRQKSTKTQITLILIYLFWREKKVPLPKRCFWSSFKPTRHCMFELLYFIKSCLLSSGNCFHYRIGSFLWHSPEIFPAAENTQQKHLSKVFFFTPSSSSLIFKILILRSEKGVVHAKWGLFVN